MAVHELGHRSHDGRNSGRARHHRPAPDREGRGRVPRPPRCGADVDQTAIRNRRSGHCASHRAVDGRFTRGVLADTVVVPYNDPEALKRALAARDVACFIVEPVMENIGICLPLPGYLESVREITRTTEPCCSSTRSRPGSRPAGTGPIAPRGAPDLIASANRSAAGCRWARSVARRSAWTRSPAAACCMSARTTGTRCAWRQRGRRSARFAPPRKRARHRTEHAVRR